MLRYTRHEIPRKTLKRHRTPGRRVAQALHLIPPMGWDLSGGMERKPVDTGPTGARAGGEFPCIPQARSNTAHCLSGPLAQDDALLHGGGQGAGELGRVDDKGSILCGHGGVDARLQGPQVA